MQKRTVLLIVEDTFDRKKNPEADFCEVGFGINYLFLKE